MTDQTPSQPTFPDEYVDQVRAAEAAAQRSVCDVPGGKTPDALAKALERRVEVNLAQADGRTVVRIGSTDPEVRELEAPFSRRRARQTVAAPQTRGSHRRRATKKAAAKKATTKKENS